MSLFLNADRTSDKNCIHEPNSQLPVCQFITDLVFNVSSTLVFLILLQLCKINKA